MKTLERTIALPNGIEASIEGKTVSLSSGSKKNVRKFHAEGIEFEKKGSAIVLRADKRAKKINAIMNTVEAHIYNMIEGLEKGFERKLAVVYSHFPISVAVKGGFVEISNFSGEKKPRKARIFGTSSVEIKGKDITVKGNDKEAVSQTAAGIENASRVGNKDRRVFQDGIYLVNTKQ